MSKSNYWPAAELYAYHGMDMENSSVDDRRHVEPRSPLVGAGVQEGALPRSQSSLAASIMDNRHACSLQFVLLTLVPILLCHFQRSALVRTLRRAVGRGGLRDRELGRENVPPEVFRVSVTGMTSG